MQRTLAKLIAFSGCTLMVAHVLAQVPVQTARSAAVAPSQTTAAPASAATAAPVIAAAKPGTTGPGLKVAAAPPSVRAVTAAGSVIILADGIVANATMAQILPPAPGFVYER